MKYTVRHDEGHYAIASVDSLQDSKLTIEQLTKKETKNNYGLQSFASIELIECKSDTPIEFYVILENKKYRCVPKKTKVESKKVFTSTKILGINAYPVALNNFIEKRKNKLYVTRKMTYYTIIEVGEKVEHNPVDIAYTHALMYIFEIPNNDDLECTTVGVVPKIFGKGPCVLNITDDLPLARLKNIPNIHKLAPQNYINFCEIITQTKLAPT
jgi:hypothetical protein